jgi:hypothetical protein
MGWMGEERLMKDALCSAWKRVMRGRGSGGEEPEGGVGSESGWEWEWE